MLYPFTLDQLALLGTLMREAGESKIVERTLRRRIRRLGQKMDVRLKAVDLSTKEVNLLIDFLSDAFVGLRHAQATLETARLDENHDDQRLQEAKKILKYEHSVLLDTVRVIREKSDELDSSYTFELE